MKVSLVVVCHHSSEVLPPCLESFRREAAEAGVEAEVVGIEHSEDADEFTRAEQAGFDRLIERPNRGYAAGLNAGALPRPSVLRRVSRPLARSRGCGTLSSVVELIEQLLSTKLWSGEPPYRCTPSPSLSCTVNRG